MKITIEFNSVEEYLEFKEKTAQEGKVQEQLCDNTSLIKTTKDYISIILR